MDRLPAVEKALLQRAAVIGKDLPFSLLQAIADVPTPRLDAGLKHLQTAEFLYELRGVPEPAFTFKHALTQDVAYQSLLTSTRQQVHQQIAQALVERFPETVETQPELLAHHYTEAGLIEQALPYWHRAGDHATQHVANPEAIGHFNQALELLATLPDTPERVQHALTLYVALAERLEVTKGMGNPDVERAYTRARELCLQTEDSPLLDQVLMGLFSVHYNRSELPQARELAEQLLSRAQCQHDPFLLLTSYRFLGHVLFEAGEIVSAHARCAQGNALYDLRLHPQQQLYDPGFHDASTRCRAYGSRPLWHLGYADQALARSQEALTLAQELARPFGLACVLVYVACIHQHRREVQAARERAEAAITLCREHGFIQWQTMGMHLLGWAMAMQGQIGEGITQMRQSLDTWRAMGTEHWQPYFLALLAEAYGKAGRTEAGLTVLAEALVNVDQTGQRVYEPELYRLKGELLLNAECGMRSAELTPEDCFQKALSLAQDQQAKSLELRAAMSLACLWQRDKRTEARNQLAPIYSWFTEGFDTADLQEAKALLVGLA